MSCRRLCSGFIAVLFVCTASSGAQAQGKTLYVTVEGQWHRGTLLNANPRGVAVDTDAGKLQLRFHTDSTVTMRGTGDAGFLAVGAVVQVSGQLNGKTLEDADVSVHVNPKATAKPGIVRHSSNTKDFSIKGRVTSLNPLTVRTIDMVRMEVKSQGIGIPSPPTSAGKLLTVALKNPTPESVPLVLAYNLRLAEQGDPISVFVADKKPGYVRNATITKTEPLKSKAAVLAEKREKEQEKKKGKDEQK